MASATVLVAALRVAPIMGLRACAEAVWRACGVAEWAAAGTVSPALPSSNLVSRGASGDNSAPRQNAGRWDNGRAIDRDAGAEGGGFPSSPGEGALRRRRKAATRGAWLRR